MTKANECTCPSGDGSLRHPCPAHPASVELAGVAANLTFINGRPAMCGCQVEYSSGGGEYSDVIYVTLCAKHSGSAILDLVATNRIALTPEYEGQWHADLYLDREIPLAKAEGATPAEAVLALMSAERIDPEQESVEQAGGDERDINAHAFPDMQSHSYYPAGTVIKLPAAAPGKSVPQAWLDVQAERRRQVEAEGWTPEHDDAHSHGQMARAAACYALAGSSAPSDGTAALLVSLAWPWDEQWWKPTSARRDLVKACALGLAEIERLDRAGISQNPQPGATTASS